MSVRHVENAEDLRDYLADKGLHEAYKIRDEIQKSHSIDRLKQMWLDQERRAPSPVIPAPNSRSLP